jgi:hypothetical protein
LKKQFNYWIFVALAVLTATGCSRSPEDSATIEARLGRLGLSYGLYAGDHDGTPPQNIEELRRYVERTTSSVQLTALKATNVDELFASPRDGQPYKMIKLPRLPSPIGGQPRPVVLYEQFGQQGKRYVAYLGGGVEEIDAETFIQLVSSVR